MSRPLRPLALANIPKHHLDGGCAVPGYWNCNGLGVHRRTVTGDQRDFHRHRGLTGQVAFFNSVLHRDSQLGLNKLVDLMAKKLLRSCRFVKAYGKWIYKNDSAFSMHDYGIR